MENKLNFTEELIKIGLTDQEADVYQTLINKGERIASNLKRHLSTKMSRPMLYFILDKLTDVGIIEKIERKNKPTLFAALHPKFLENLLLKKETELEKTKESFERIIGNLTSSYNLIHNKPHVEFAEGLEGAKKILNDTLTSKETIYTVIDTDELEKYAGEINREYISKRKNRDIKKKILMVDSPLARAKKKNNTDSKTEIRIINSENIKSFGATANIYENKVSFITFKEMKVVATLIYDQEIYKMNRFIFEALWDRAEK